MEENISIKIIEEAKRVIYDRLKDEHRLHYGEIKELIEAFERLTIIEKDIVN